MPKDNESIPLADIGPVAPSEPQGFTPDQMIRCEECLRANPPTRVACLYCAAPLPATEEMERLRKPTLRPPEKHQVGYNSIYLPTGQDTLTAGTITAAANLLKIKTEDLQRIVNATQALPVARTANREEAELVYARLSEIGLATVILSDQELGSSDGAIARVRALSLDHNGLTVMQSSGGEGLQSSWADVVLIVSGRLVQKTVELTEMKSRKAENEILSSSEFYSDEAVIDFYLKSSEQTWRIAALGFDFSCLGNLKTLIANENIGRLLRLLSEKCSEAVVDASYNALRQTLEPVWLIERETSSRGWRRERPGRVSLGATSIQSNESQFNRYSRLRFHFCRPR